MRRQAGKCRSPTPALRPIGRTVDDQFSEYHTSKGQCKDRKIPRLVPLGNAGPHRHTGARHDDLVLDGHKSNLVNADGVKPNLKMLLRCFCRLSFSLSCRLRRSSAACECVRNGLSKYGLTLRLRSDASGSRDHEAVAILPFSADVGKTSCTKPVSVFSPPDWNVGKVSLRILEPSSVIGCRAPFQETLC